jgi:hypothetical protein
MSSSSHRTQGNTYAYWFIVKYIIKVTDEELYRLSYGGRGVMGLPCCLWVYHPARVSSSGNSLNPDLLGFYGNFTA